EAGAGAAVRLRHADREQAFTVHVAEILDRESGVAVVLCGARGQYAGAEPPRLVDQRGVLIGEPKRRRIEDRRVGSVAIEGGAHKDSSTLALSDNKTLFRNPITASLNRAGASRLDRWPTPGRHVKRAPGMRPAMRSIIGAGALRSYSPARHSTGMRIRGRLRRSSKPTRQCTAARNVSAGVVA